MNEIITVPIGNITICRLTTDRLISNLQTLCIFSESKEIQKVLTRFRNIIFVVEKGDLK